MYQGTVNETICFQCATGSSDFKEPNQSETLRVEPSIHQIEAYMVYVVDKYKAPISENISMVPAEGLQRTCCETEAYSTRVRLTLPAGARYFSVVAYTKDWGPLPAGTYVEIEDLTP